MRIIVNRTQIIGISLLLVIGCQSTLPPVQQSEILNPFPFASRMPPVQFPDVAIFSAEHRLNETEYRPNESEEYYEECEPFSFSFVLDGVPPMSHAEQIELLSQPLWSKNLARINLINQGRAVDSGGLSPEERQRRQQMSDLNLSEQERATRQHRQFQFVDGSASDWRWMHRGVDRVYTLPPEQRVRPQAILRNEYRNRPILQANVVILWGREGDPKAIPPLKQLVQSETTNINIRCAAAEVLGRMPTITAYDLIPLLENVKDREVEVLNRQTGEMETRHQPGTLELWEELLIAIAETVDPWDYDAFLEPFYSQSSSIRLETARIWRRAGAPTKNGANNGIPTKLPDRFLEIAQRERNSSVRVELIRTLAIWDVPDLFQLLERDLGHHMAEVRNAAMNALAEAGVPEALPFVQTQVRDDIPGNRAVAVAALRKLGAFDDVFRLADDGHFTVRVEVARALSERCTPQTASIARTYIADRSRDVQLATIEAISGWSFEESGELFLTAARSSHPEVRRRATALLAQRGISYCGFNPDARPDSQTAQHQELIHAFREIIGYDPMLDIDVGERTASTTSAIRQVSASVPDDRALAEVRRSLDDWSNPEQREAVGRRLTGYGHRLMPMIDHLMTVENRNIPESLDRVLAEVDPMFREIERLKSNDIASQRTAARELAHLGMIDAPSKLAVRRMMDVIGRQHDPMVLSSLLTALRNADGGLVAGLARPLLQSESIEVRRVGCEMLKLFGSSKDVPLLHPLLHDPNRGVVRGALLAIDAQWDHHADNTAVLSTLNTMLHRSDTSMQTHVAATLHRQGYSEGTDALRRLAQHSDYRVRNLVAQTVSGLDDQAFVPMLLHFLDDGNATVRNSALEGLPTLVGEDIGRRGLSTSSSVAQTQQQIDNWKAWGRERRIP